MNKLRFLVSLITKDNDYQMEQAAAARSAATDLGVESGRIQPRQVLALLPHGGSLLYIQGSSVSSVSKERHTALMEMLPGNVRLTALRGRWTEESAHQSVSSWLKLMAAQKLRLDLVLAQNDVMGMGAKKAIEETVVDSDRGYWGGIPVTGCDGVLKTGQTWVRTGHLTATVIVPPSAGKALALMFLALRTGATIPEHTFTAPALFAEIEKLTPRKLPG